MKNEMLRTKIACLDDDPIIQTKVKMMFSKRGYEVFCTDSWAEVNRLIFKENVKLLLCDVNLSGISGDKICRILKEGKVDVRIYFFSSLDIVELSELAEEHNADGWISKSTLAKQWVDTFEQYLNNASAISTTKPNP